MGYKEFQGVKLATDGEKRRKRCKQETGGNDCAIYRWKQAGAKLDVITLAAKGKKKTCQHRIVYSWTDQQAEREKQRMDIVF